MTKFSFEPEKESRREKIKFLIKEFMFFIIGLAIGIGLLSALGLWPERLTF